MSKAAQLTALTRARDEAGASLEAYDPTYVEALVREGIDLPKFLQAWLTATYSDLEELRTVGRVSGFSASGAVLHRLSGAVGLVGAGSLADALQRASIAKAGQPAMTSVELSVLMIRTEQLAIYLKALQDALRSAES